MELVKIADNSGDWYWFIDYRYKDNSSGIGAESIRYKSDIEAYDALLNNRIDWEAMTDSVTLDE